MNGMSCDVLERQDTAERYLLDQLTGVERDEFERHFLECDSCAALLETNLALQTELQLHPPPLPSVAAVRHRAWIWAPALASVLVVSGLGIWWSLAHQQRPSTVAAPSASGVHSGPAPSTAPSRPAAVIEQLARVAPPPYVAATLRGPEDRAQEGFRKAMQYYVKGDYGAAIGGLRSAAIASPRTPAFSFYLGACYLLTNQVEDGVDALRRTVSLGDSAYFESAHFLLGKAYLAEGKVPAAKAELQTTVRLRGSKETEARDILDQLSR